MLISIWDDNNKKKLEKLWIIVYACPDLADREFGCFHAWEQKVDSR